MLKGLFSYGLLIFKEKIQNHLIKGNTIIVRPKERVDFLRICSFKITLNETEEVFEEAKKEEKMSFGESVKLLVSK